MNVSELKATLEATEDGNQTAELLKQIHEMSSEIITRKLDAKIYDEDFLVACTDYSETSKRFALLAIGMVYRAPSTMEIDVLTDLFSRAVNTIVCCAKFESAIELLGIGQHTSAPKEISRLFLLVLIERLKGLLAAFDEMRKLGNLIFSTEMQNVRTEDHIYV